MVDNEIVKVQNLILISDGIYLKEVDIDYLNFEVENYFHKEKVKIEDFKDLNKELILDNVDQEVFVVYNQDDYFHMDFFKRVQDNNYKISNYEEYNKVDTKVYMVYHFNFIDLIHLFEKKNYSYRNSFTFVDRY